MTRSKFDTVSYVLFKTHFAKNGKKKTAKSIILLLEKNGNCIQGKTFLKVKVERLDFKGEETLDTTTRK